MTTGQQDIVHTKLDNGMMILIEPNDSVRSVAIRLALPCGVIHEPSERLGLSTICSELLMRGTKELDSREQARAFDRAGVLRDCSPGMRTIGISLTTIAQRTDEALGLLEQMVLNPRLDADSFDPSRELALASIAALADDPQERAVLAARGRHLPSPFHRNTYGSQAGLEALTHDEVISWWSSHASAEGSILSIAGSVDPDRVIERVQQLFGSWGGQAPTHDDLGTPPRGYAHEEDDSNQHQIVYVHDGPRAADDDSVYERIVCAILGGSMSSRLFTEMRERRGLCYAVSTGYRADRDRGVVTNYVGTTPDRAQESLDVMVQEIDRLIKDHVSEDEFARAIMGLKSRAIFSGESTAARAQAMIADYLTFGRPRPLSELIDRINNATLTDVNGYLDRRPMGEPTIQTIGQARLDIDS